MNKRMMPYNEAYTPYFKSDKPFAILYGGAGSGKSVAAAQKMITRTIQETAEGFKHRQLVVRKFKSSIRNSVYELIKSSAFDMGLGGYFKANSTDMSFHFEHNGAEIITTGIDDVEKIKSIANITSVWIEEATELTLDEFKQLTLRLRGRYPVYKQMTLSLNPISELHWIKKTFWDEASIQDRVFKLRTTYKHNNFLDKDYITKLESDYLYDENMYRIYVKGEWGRIKTGMNWYSRFSYHDHVKETDYQPGYPLHISFDFNYNPYMPLGIFQVIYEKGVYNVRMIDEIALKNPDNTTGRLCEVFLERYGGLIKEPIFVYGDAHGKAHSPYSTMNHYETIEMKLRGVMTNNSLRILPKNPSLERRMGFINRVLYSDKMREQRPEAAYPISISISPRCQLMINDLESVSVGDEGKKVVKTKKDPVTSVSYQEDGHFADLFDYFLCGCFERYFIDFTLKK